MFFGVFFFFLGGGGGGGGGCHTVKQATNYSDKPLRYYFNIIIKIDKMSHFDIPSQNISMFFYHLND